MAFSALKPSSCITRMPPHRLEQQEKEVYNMLLVQEEEEEERDEDEEEDADTEKESPPRESFTCENPDFKQLLSSYSNPSSISCKSSSPLEELPTFIAPQGLHSLRPSLKECTKNRFAKHERNGRHLVPLCEEAVFTHSFRDISIPVSDFRQHRTHSSIYSMLRSKPKEPIPGHPDYIAKQKLHTHERHGGTDSGIYGHALDQTVSMHEPGGEKKRHSSACARDMITRKEVAMLKNRFCDAQPSSWEEEVRQAMANSSLSKRPNHVAKGGAIADSLQRSVSVKEQHGSSGLPYTLIVKRPDGPGNVDAAPICTDETAGAKLIHDTGAGGCTFLNKGVPEKKRMWKGFNVVKSPSEERWEEAAQDEHRQEMQRRARSQSMRYDTHLRTSDLISGSDKAGGTSAFYNDEPEWAVYTRSGYVSAKPRKSDADASSTCCRSLMGRSLSMRDTRMGLVMECAACGTALHGAGGHLLCFCSCCVAARSSTMQATPSSQKKKGGSGIMRVCRRLLGLSKKRLGNH